MRNVDRKLTLEPQEIKKKQPPPHKKNPPLSQILVDVIKFFSNCLSRVNEIANCWYPAFIMIISCLKAAKDSKP